MHKYDQITKCGIITDPPFLPSNYVLVFLPPSPTPPPSLHLFFSYVVPKKLLQEQGSRPPVYSPPPSAHDPNIVGDSPPEGTSVKSHNSVPGTCINVLAPSPPASQGELVTINSPQTPPCCRRKSNSGLESGHTCMYVCLNSHGSTVSICRTAEPSG